MVWLLHLQFLVRFLQFVFNCERMWFVAHQTFFCSSGNFDVINQPKNISEYAKNTVCFFMFIDEETEAALKATGTLESSKKIGLWRIVVVHNLPYKDARRTGKVNFLILVNMVQFV